MSEAPLHKLYHHYSELPISMRIVYTAALCILGMGYLFGMLYLVHVYSGRDGNPMTLSYEDLVIAYSGSGKGSKLESALRGPMASMLPAEEASALVTWAQQGAERNTYETFIRPTIDKRCMTCHDGSNPHLSNFGGYDNIKKVTEQDTGTGFYTLVRVSHIHLFGMTFIFFIIGTIFSHAYVRPLWFKYMLIGLPFLAEAIDIFSWYLVKVYHPFAYVTMGAGGLMGVSFAAMWFISMYQLWLSGTPEAVAERHGVKEIIVG